MGSYSISEREGIDWAGRAMIRFVILKNRVEYMGESTVRREAEEWIARREEIDAAIPG